LQHLAYKAQIAEKINILQEDFIRIGHFKDMPEIRVRDAGGAREFGYRNRVQFHRIKAQICGFMAKRGGEIVPVTACPVADAGINTALAEKRIIPPVEKDRWTVFSYKDTFLAEGRNSRGAVGILDKRLFVDAGVFFQSNAAMLEALVRDILSVAEEAGPVSSAADLYCGIGTFAAFLKPVFEKNQTFRNIDMVEENKTALNIARDNVRGAGVEHFAVSTDKWAKDNKKSYDFIIADPPREGLSPGLRAWLCAYGGARNAPVFAYVSCNPATLARDSGILAESGYGLSSLTFYDFYPQTPHIESLALFKRP
jgi:23S rRNA (uracil1939-C5)-methyltransferase